jgi:hypothetical protein
MRYILIILTSFIFWSCEKTVSLDLEQITPKIVIEGVVTTQPGYQFVKVSRSANFYESGQTPRITDALVSVKDDLDNEIVFVHNPNFHPDSAGYYLAPSSFVGVVEWRSKDHADFS